MKVVRTCVAKRWWSTLGWTQQLTGTRRPVAPRAHVAQPSAHVAQHRCSRVRPSRPRGPATSASTTRHSGLLRSALVPSAAEGYESRALLLLQITSRADRTELLINNWWHFFEKNWWHLYRRQGNVHRIIWCPSRTPDTHHLGLGFISFFLPRSEKRNKERHKSQTDRPTAHTTAHFIHKYYHSQHAFQSLV